ncbi:MAG: serpin family protein [Bacteroidota bacterium]
MRKLFLSALLITIACVACNNNDPIDTSSKNTELALSDLRKVSKDFTTKSNKFTFDIFRKINTGSKTSENLMISPLSINLALGMLLNGTNNETESQIKTTLDLTTLDIHEINENYKNLIFSLPNLDNAVDVGIANSVWHDEIFLAKEGFLSSLKNNFNAQVTGYDFGRADAPDMINNWVENNTNGLIKKIVENIKPDVVMLLINALYFKGDWTVQFDSKNTKKESFKTADGIDKTVDMMYLSKVKVSGIFKENYAVFDLPYGDGLYNMRIILPNEDVLLSSILNALNQEDWNNISANTYELNANVGLPKFEIVYELKLNEVLKELGILDAFDGSKADLSNISDVNLFISEVKHKAFINVNEQGTEAAAVTSVAIAELSAGPSKPVDLICDRPFAFFIYEKEQGNILFSGRYINP